MERPRAGAVPPKGSRIRADKAALFFAFSAFFVVNSSPRLGLYLFNRKERIERREEGPKRVCIFRVVRVFGGHDLRKAFKRFTAKYAKYAKGEKTVIGINSEDAKTRRLDVGRWLRD